MKITQGKPGSGVSFIGCRVGQTAEEALREKEARKAEEKLMMAEIAAQKEKAAAPPGREEEKKVEEEEGKDALDLSKAAMIPIDRKLMNKEAQTALDGIKGFPPITDQLSGMWAGLKTQLTPQELHERVGTTAALYGQTTDVCYRTENANPWNPDNKFSYFSGWSPIKPVLLTTTVFQQYGTKLSQSKHRSALQNRFPVFCASGKTLRGEIHEGHLLL